MLNLFNPPSYVRILHASPDAPAVDVYIDKEKVARNISFANLTDYLRLKPGRYNIQVFPAGSARTRPVLNENVYVPPQSIYTIAVVNRLNNLSMFIITDPENQPEPDTSYLRVAHLSPNAPPVNIRLDNRTLFRSLSYRDVSRYAVLRPATYDLNVIPGGGDQSVLTIDNIVLQSSKYYTIYILGLVNEEPPLQAITPLDGRYEFI